MEKQTWLKRLIKRIEKNREVIHFSGLILTLFFAGSAGIWACFEFSDSQPSEMNSNISYLITTPIISGILHFLFVFFLGSLIIATISTAHARRMKAFNLEVEFETREHKEIKVGQAHYLSGILKTMKQLSDSFLMKNMFLTGM